MMLQFDLVYFLYSTVSMSFHFTSTLVAPDKVVTESPCHVPRASVHSVFFQEERFGVIGRQLT